jgi:RimJ/RimL family protein N-acetyltransferase
VTELQLRRATPDDAPRLWVWSNDGPVRTQAFSGRPISWGEHMGWFERVLADPGSRLWILQCDGHPAGQLRADRAADRARIDYSIAREYRGRGLAPQLLRLGAALACDELGVSVVDGIVKESNLASCRSFERAGFALAARLEEQGHSCRRYEWHSGRSEGAACGC